MGSLDTPCRGGLGVVHRPSGVCSLFLTEASKILPKVGDSSTAQKRLILSVLKITVLIYRS